MRKVLFQIRKCVRIFFSGQYSCHVMTFAEHNFVMRGAKTFMGPGCPMTLVCHCTKQTEKKTTTLELGWMVFVRKLN